MRALLQRVTRAEVRVDGCPVGAIRRGLLVFVGCRKGDRAAEAERLAVRVAGYRVFEDSAGRTNLDVSQAQGEVLVVSQFTLAASTRKGRRPSFDPALVPEAARGLVDRFCAALEKATGRRVARGVFGASMEVELVNAGPATFLLEVRPRTSTT